MNAYTPSRRAIAVTALILLLLTTATVSAPPAGARIGRPERKLARRLNDYRAGHSVGRLNLNARLSRVAERNSKRMADQNTILHSSNIPCSGRNGEVSGAGAGWGDAFRNLRRSGVHRQIMLRPYWRKMGVGVRRSPDNGLTYVTVSFCD